MNFPDGNFPEYDEDDERFTKVTPQELKSLESERSTFDETETQMTNRIFRQNAIAAAQSVCKIALFGQSERLRLDAAKYVVERNLGRVQDQMFAPEDDPFMRLFDDVLVDVDDDLDAPVEHLEGGPA